METSPDMKVCISAVRQTHRPRISRKVAPEDKGATPPLGECARYLKAALLLVPHLCGAAFALPRSYGGVFLMYTTLICT